VPRISASIHTERPTGNFLTKHVNQYKNEGQQKQKIVSETLYEKICKLGKCFKYGDKFVPEHQCDAKGLHMIEGNEDECEEFMDAEVGNTTGNIEKNSKIEEYSLSLNVLADNYAHHNTIKIIGSYQKKELIVLIDSGSTHNFVDE
jgi:hypothetical protein